MLEQLESRCVAVLQENFGDVAHDLSHVRRVVKNARALAQQENGNLWVLLPAAWLHDCVCLPKDAPNRAESSRLAADQAVTWLKDWGYPKVYLPDIHHAIVAHSFSAKVAPQTQEAKILQDADRLDAMGAIGLSRCLLVGGITQKPLYDVADPFCVVRHPDDAQYTLDHLFTKLLTLEGQLHTNTAKAWAKPRMAFLRQYLAQLKLEGV